MKQEFSISMDLFSDEDGYKAELDYADSNGKSLSLDSSENSLEDICIDLYDQLIEELLNQEDNKEEEPEEEFTQEEYIKKLEAEIQELRKEKEASKKQKYVNKIYYKPIKPISSKNLFDLLWF